jgi:hypothetical protein
VLRAPTDRHPRWDLQPAGRTRSAITVAGIRGNAASSSRIRGPYPSTSDPDRARTYLGDSSLANAAFVFREQPISRAISEIETPIARSASASLTASSARDSPRSPRTHSAVFAQIDPAGSRLSELARGANMSPQAMGELVDELESLGYVI